MVKKTRTPPSFMNELHCGIVAAGLGVESSVAAALDTHGLDHSVVQFAIPGNVPFIL